MGAFVIDNWRHRGGLGFRSSLAAIVALALIAPLAFIRGATPAYAQQAPASDGPPPLVCEDHRPIALEQVGESFVGQGSGLFIAVGRQRANMRLLCLDLTQLESVGIEYPVKVRVEIDLGNGRSAASFGLWDSTADLYPGITVPSSQITARSLDHAYDIPPGRTAVMEIEVTPEMGRQFYISAGSNWGSRAPATNTFDARVEVTSYAPLPGSAVSQASAANEASGTACGDLPEGVALTFERKEGALVGEAYGLLSAPGYGNTRNQVHCVDLADLASLGFDGSTSLNIFARMADRESAGSFSVYRRSDLSYADLRPGLTIPSNSITAKPLAGAYDIKPGKGAQLKLDPAQGQAFWLVASGNWLSQEGSTNAYMFRLIAQ